MCTVPNMVLLGQWNLSIKITQGTQPSSCCTVEPVYKDHCSDQLKVVFVDKCPYVEMVQCILNHTPRCSIVFTLDRWSSCRDDLWVTVCQSCGSNCFCLLHDFMTPFNMVQYPMCALLSIVCDVLHVLSLTAEGDDRENL